ncbi:MAG: ribbon-helix-helix protein, CopG family [Acidimicrobiales bacterium]|nr:ribbon-helix-helix protein, CopG family [Acidimicrobiales bacterium]MCB1248693.1 ribbon-helix-helix protein, CopG family [Acidimicrobiales bacterium]
MSDKPKQIYGRTKTGLDITDELIEKYVAEAEAGFDLSKLRRVRGRPRMGAAPAKSFPVRLDPALRAALDERAAEEDKPAAEVVREALRRHLAAS